MSRNRFNNTCIIRVVIMTMIGIAYIYYTWNHQWNQTTLHNNVLLTIFVIIIILLFGITNCIMLNNQKLKHENVKIISLYNELKKSEKRDFLTGLPNRRFFIDETKEIDQPQNYPISVIMGDIDGLKMVNDTCGHIEGDKLIVTIADILKGICRDSDRLARLGGDEFCILLPKTAYVEVESIAKRIDEACKEYKNKENLESYSLSISLGYATKTDSTVTMDHIMKDAEDSMSRHKMLNNKSLHSSIINSMKSSLYEKSKHTEEHAQRLVHLSYLVGKQMMLSEKQLKDLELLSTLHDIGKIGISDLILNKPDRLSEDEWIEMKKHPEIGYRITMTAPELVPIAQYILCHHERWDGTGYPNGLKGEEIPLIARIIMLSDAYDAMTTDRPYRRALTMEEAIHEIKLCSGTQFDPDITEIFVNALRSFHNYA